MTSSSARAPVLVNVTKFVVVFYLTATACGLLGFTLGYWAGISSERACTEQKAP